MPYLTIGQCVLTINNCPITIGDSCAGSYCGVELLAQDRSQSGTENEISLNYNVPVNVSLLLAAVSYMGTDGLDLSGSSVTWSGGSVSAGDATDELNLFVYTATTLDNLTGELFSAITSAVSAGRILVQIFAVSGEPTGTPDPGAGNSSDVNTTTLTVDFGSTPDGTVTQSLAILATAFGGSFGADDAWAADVGTRLGYVEAGGGSGQEMVTYYRSSATQVFNWSGYESRVAAVTYYLDGATCD